jgi:hypothetical protein
MLLGINGFNGVIIRCYNHFLLFIEDHCRELEETVARLREELATKSVTDEGHAPVVSEDGHELTQIRIQLENTKKDLEKMAESNQR